MRRFRWLSARALPWVRDLRRCDWQLRAGTWATFEDAALLAPDSSDGLFDPSSLPPGERRRTVVIGAEDPARRVRLLASGCGDALGGGITIEELASRAERVCAVAQRLPRLLAYGRLTLDLMLRDARLGGTRLGLHPREFALLWRLIEAAGAPLSAADLIAHVWQLAARPETNSLAVHISRLRRKLALTGMGAPLETLPNGSYRLRTASAFAFDFDKNALDAESGLRKEPRVLTEISLMTKANR